VPLIAPVDESKDNPTGRLGETDQLVTVPPLTDGVAVVIAMPFVNVNGLPLYATEAGDASLTRIVIVVVALPPVLLAVTVYDVEEDTAVGVPEISPVEVEKERPAGTAGEIDQDVTAPPLEVGVAVVIAVSFVKVNGVPL